MAKLAEMVIRRAVDLIREENVVEFDQFIRKSIQLMDHDRVSQYIQRLVDDGKIADAIDFWCKITEDYNATTTIFWALLKWAAQLLYYVGVAGGVVGGWWYLIDRFL